jgi:hypothetical protein
LAWFHSPSINALSVVSGFAEEHPERLKIPAWAKILLLFGYAPHSIKKSAVRISYLI